MQKNIILKKFHKRKNNKKMFEEKKITFKAVLIQEQILPKNNWFKNFEKIWSPSEESALKRITKFY